MELKTARFTVLLDPAKKKALEELCARQDVTPSQVIRKLIREYLAANEVTFIPSGLESSESEEPASRVRRKADRGRRAGAKRTR
jgi:predicted transcriptional regulator